jgi:hypothetical protein
MDGVLLNKNNHLASSDNQRDRAASMWQHRLDDASLDIRKVMALDQVPVGNLNHPPLVFLLELGL